MTATVQRAPSPGFGTALRRLREQRRVSLRSLALLVPFDHSTLSKVELGQRAATQELAQQCDQALNAGGALVRVWRARLAAALPSPPRLIGRGQQIALMNSAATLLASGTATVVVVEGEPGAGTSTVGVWWARQVNSRFRDGALYVDLRRVGADDRDVAARALQHFCVALGAPSVPIDLRDRTSLYRSLLADRRMMIVLDNAASSEQVLALLPASPGCLVVVTTSAALPELTALNVRRVPVPSALADADAVAMLAHLVGRRRVEDEPAAAAAIAKVCRHRPAALRQAAELLTARPSLTIAQLAADLPAELAAADADVTTRLGAMPAAGTVWLAPADQMPFNAHDRGEPVGTAAHPEVATAWRVAQLPSRIRSFVGRTDELDHLSELPGIDGTSDFPVVVIVGPPGVGKTSLALQWAQSIVERFPDGALFADLRGYAASASVSAQDVLEEFLLALGVAPAAIPLGETARAALYRSVLAERRMLIVLDNALDPDHVRPLLPGSPGCMVVVTSRQRLSGLAVRDNAIAVRLGPLPSVDATALLRTIIGDDRVLAEPDAADELARVCSFLPLALRVAAERIAARPHLTLAALVRDLADETDRLDLLAVADDGQQGAVRSVFSWSYRSLDEDTARLFRLLSQHPGPDISLAAAAALNGHRSGITRRQLDQLTGMHLLQETDSERYQFHDLLRVYASELAEHQDSADGRIAAQHRLVAWYLTAANHAATAMAPYRRRLTVRLDVGDTARHPVSTDTVCDPSMSGWFEAMAWFETELPNLTAVTALAATTAPVLAHQLPEAAWDFFRLRKLWRTWMTLNQHGRTAAVICADPLAEARAVTNIGNIYLDLAQYEPARHAFTDALALCRESGDLAEEAWTLLGLGKANLGLGEVAEATELMERAHAIYTDLDDPWAAGMCTGPLAAAALLQRRHHRAKQLLDGCLTAMQEVGDRQGQGCAMLLLAQVHISRGQLDLAREHLDRAVGMRGVIGDRLGQAETLLALSGVQRDQGEYDDAAESMTRAWKVFDELGDPRAALILSELGEEEARRWRTPA